MPKQPSARSAVSAALQALCAEAPSPGQILFRTWFTAKNVAKRAGCSEGTARRHLDGLMGYRGYSRHRFSGGRHGYRHDEGY